MGSLSDLGLQSIFGLPFQVDSIKAGLTPPPLLRTQLEELTMFSEAEARWDHFLNKDDINNNLPSRNVIETTVSQGSEDMKRD